MIGLISLFWTPVASFQAHFWDTGNVKFALYATATEYGFNIYTKTSYLESLRNVVGRIGRRVEIPQIQIDIKAKDWFKLDAKRIQALESGSLIQEADDLVPAIIRYQNHVVKVKMRLKGDMLDHLTGNKWSFRIKTRDGGQLFGMRNFSIQNPVVRHYQGEPLYQETLGYYGIVGPRILYIHVIINGNSLGVMMVEEHFAKELIEWRGRREGIIIRFDETLLWKAIDPKKLFAYGPFDDYKNTKIAAYQEGEIAKSPALTEQYRVAVGLLRGFTAGVLPASELFDVNKLGMFLAVSHAFGGSHATYWSNIRFYFNPVTLRLEPVGYNGEIFSGGGSVSGIVSENPLVKDMLADSLVVMAYIKGLRQISVDLDNGLIAYLKKIEDIHLDRLQTEYSLLEPYDYSVLKARLGLSPKSTGVVAAQLQTINQRLPPTPTVSEDDINRFPQIIHAYIMSDVLKPHLEIHNSVPLPVKIYAIDWIDETGRRTPVAVADTDSSKILTEVAPYLGTQKPYRVYYKPPPDGHTYTVKVQSGIHDEDRRFTNTVIPYYDILSRNPLPVSDMQKQKKIHPFIRLIPEDSLVVIPDGVRTVMQSIVIPHGYRLKIEAGTTLQFAPDTFLFLQDSFSAVGTETEPIIFEGLPKKDSEQGTWQGVVVLNAPSTSQWSHVTIRNTSGIDYAPWRLTGGVTFYYSDINMNHCTFSGDRGEDALNIIHSHFNLDDIRIMQTASDGFDGDFTTGTITGSLFQDIGLAGEGDAFDLSGSEVTMEDTRFVRINDKALSVGEQSRLTVHRTTAEDIGIGAASKDRSILIITDSTIKRARVAGLLAYIKKPEYGPAQLTATEMVILESDLPAKVQTGSTLHLNGDLIETEDMDVDVLYNTVMKRGIR